MVKGKRAGEPAKGRQKGPRTTRKPAEEAAAAKATKPEATEKQAKPPKPQPAAPIELSDAEKSDTFFNIRRRYIAAKGKEDVCKVALRTAANARAEVVKDAKGYGITRDEIEISILLDSPEGEAKVRNEMQRTITIAKWMNSSVGTQFEMFTDRTPAVDIARKQGYRDSQENLSRSPKYDPSTEQYRAYMDGYNDHQAFRASGFKPPAQNGHSDDQPAANAAADGKPVGSVPPEPVRHTDGEPVTSGTPVSRAQFREGLASNEAKVNEMIGNQPASFQV